MILVDTGALYALVDRNDRNHKEAKRCYEAVLDQEVLATSLPVLTESWLLLEARLGVGPARKLWQAVLQGAFELLDIGPMELQLAWEIEKKYADARFGLVDTTCFALCERHKIRKVFTYDRKHFALYRPTFTAAFTLLPE